MKQKSLGKRIAAWFLCFAMVLTTINLPAFTNEVKAEGTTTVQAPSVTAFATVDNLKDASKFALYKENSDSNAVAQKVIFGKGKAWYIAGADTDGSLVLICDPTNPLGNSEFLAIENGNTVTHINNSQYDGKDVLENHYGASDIRRYLNGYALRFFSTAEKGMMVEPTIYTYDIKNECAYSTSDKLYLAYVNELDTYITVGANDSFELNGDIKIGLEGSNSPAGSPYANSDIDISGFWLRAPEPYGKGRVYYTHLGYIASADSAYESHNVVPAFNMNLSSVLFASAAIAASSDATFSDAMTFRVVGTGKITSSAIYDNSGIKVTKGGDGEYIYIQYKDETGDKVWSKAITDDMGISTECVGIDSFANCKIWVEKKIISENLTYVVMASSGETGSIGHTYIDDSENSNQHKCVVCGSTENHVIENCTKIDSEKHSGTCKGCGVVVQDHNYVVSSDDSSKHTCFDCGATEIHTYIYYTSDNNATCGEDGTKTGKCKYCDATDTKIDEGSATGNHDFDEEGICKECEYECAHKDVSGSTFVAGQCSVCNYNCVANGHVKNTNKKSNKNAIEHEFTCSVCGENVTENHHFESISVTSHRCADCGAIVGHDTKGKNGSCSICGYSEEGSVLVVTKFATPQQLKNANNFTLYTGNGSGVAQKVNFGEGKTWYIAGADTDGSLVLICDPTNHLGTSAFLANGKYNGSTQLNNSQYDGKDVFANHYGASDIRNNLKSLYGADNKSMFTDAEQGLMVNTPVYTRDSKNSNTSYLTSDKLYLAHGTSYNAYIIVGMNSSTDLDAGIKIGIKGNGSSGSPFVDSSNGAFWIRSPYGNFYGYCAFQANLGDKVVHHEGEFCVGNSLPVVPAFNMDISSVLFVSAATTASADATFTDAMTFRMDGTDKVTSSAVVYAGKINITKGNGDNEYLYVQGTDGETDWVYSKEITKDEIVTEENIRSSKNLSDIDLAKCIIWIETEDDNVTYAKPFSITGNHDFSDQGDGTHICADCGVAEKHDFLLENGTNNGAEKCTLCNVKNIASSSLDIKATSTTYTGKEQTAVITGIEAENYTVTGNTATNAGKYTITLTGKGDYTGTREVEWTIEKATPTVIPPISANPKYAGAWVALVASGSSDSGDMLYSVLREGGAQTDYSTDIPCADWAGRYTVYYKVEESDNWFGFAPQSVDVTVVNEKFTVAFVDDEGDEITSREYEYGTPAEGVELPPENPEKDDDDMYAYTFAGWTPEIQAVTRAMTYSPTYDKTRIGFGPVTTYNILEVSNGITRKATSAYIDGWSRETFDEEINGLEIVGDVHVYWNYQAGKLYTIMFPFETNIYNVPGVTFYSFKGIEKENGVWGKVVLENVGKNGDKSIKANTPYIVIADKDLDELVVKDGVVFDWDSPKTVTSEDGNWQFVGTYDYREWDSDHNADEIGRAGFIDEAGNFKKVEDGDFLHPMSTYLHYCGGESSVLDVYDDFYTITFFDDKEIQVGELVAVAPGTTVSAPVKPAKREGYYFVGWFKKGAETAYDFSAAVNENLELYEKWIDSSLPHNHVFVDQGDGNHKCSICDSQGTHDMSSYFYTESAHTPMCICGYTNPIAYGYPLHSYGEWDNGTRSCICGKIEICDHSFTTYVSNNDATCGADGTKSAKCDRCDVTDTKADTGSATGNHDFSDQQYSNDGSGKHHQECKVCGAKSTSEAHSGGTATCTAKATCEKCGAAYGETGAHSFINYVSNKDATCTADGTEKATCTVCGHVDTRTEVNSALGHSFSGGAAQTKCDRCDFTREATKEVENLTVTSGVGEAVLTWSAVPGAVKYAVYMKTSAGTTLLNSNVTTNSYKATGLAGGEKIGFTVRPYIDSWGSYSPVVWAMVHTPQTAVVSKVVVATDMNQATVSWSAVSGAREYALYQKNADGTTVLVSNGLTGTTYTVTGLADGARVGYSVRTKLGSTWYGYSTVTWTTLPAPAVPPTGVKAQGGDGCATVTWNAVPGAGRYALYQKSASGVVTLISAEVTGTSYEVTGLTDGETVGFVLKSRTSKGWSTWSATGWTKPQGGR